MVTATEADTTTAENAMLDSGFAGLFESELLNQGIQLSTTCPEASGTVVTAHPAPTTGVVPTCTGDEFGGTDCAVVSGTDLDQAPSS